MKGGIEILLWYTAVKLIGCFQWRRQDLVRGGHETKRVIFTG